MKYRAIFDDERDISEISRGTKKWVKSPIYFLIALALVNFLAVMYVIKSYNIYFWDDATYWDIARSLATHKTEAGFWHNVYNSIGTQDYNYVAGLLSTVIVKIFGESRLAYVIGLVNLYYIPSCIVIYNLSKRSGKAPWITTCLILLICPMFTFLTLVGFVDVGGVLIGLICMMMYYPKDERKYSILRHVVIGVLLVLIMIWRRWYAFFSVSFITAMVADAIIFRKKKIPVIITVLTAGTILFTCFRGFLVNILLKDYGNLYSAYKFSINTDLKLITRYYGTIFLLLLLSSSVAVAIKKKEYRVVFLWLQIITCFLMFVFTQTHGQQHLLLYFPAFIMLIIILVKHITEIWMLGVICFMALIQSISVFIPRVQPGSVSEIKHYALVSNFSMRPVVREDVGELLKLKNKLDSVVDMNAKLGVLSSSFLLNEDILKNVEPSVNIRQKRQNYIVSLPQVDSRDRDMYQFYNVNYILVALPAQTHLGNEKQTVVTEAVKSFEAYADFAVAYDEIPECETVIDGITVKLYKRNRMVTDEAMKEFESRLHK